jgi:hypothetical protein
MMGDLGPQDRPLAGAPADDLRQRAVKRLEDRRGLTADLLAYVMVNAFLIVIWAVTSSGFFWPIFPLFGWGIGLAFHVWGVLSPPPTEERIRAEMDRLSQPRGGAAG